MRLGGRPGRPPLLGVGEDKVLGAELIASRPRLRPRFMQRFDPQTLKACRSRSKEVLTEIQSPTCSLLESAAQRRLFASIKRLNSSPGRDEAP
jgi:hypothetical protein